MQSQGSFAFAFAFAFAFNATGGELFFEGFPAFSQFFQTLTEIVFFLRGQGSADLAFLFGNGNLAATGGRVSFLLDGAGGGFMRFGSGGRTFYHALQPLFHGSRDQPSFVLVVELVAIAWGASRRSGSSGKLSQPSDELGQLLADGFGLSLDDGGGQLGVGQQDMFLGSEVGGFVEQGILGQFAFVILHELVQLLWRNHVNFFHRALQSSHNSDRSGEARHASQRRFFNVCM